MRLFIRNLQSIELHLVSAILLAINLSNFMAKLNLCPESSEVEFACYRAFFIRKKIAPLYIIIRRGNSSNPRKTNRRKEKDKTPRPPGLLLSLTWIMGRCTCLSLARARLVERQLSRVTLHLALAQQLILYQ